ncbi:MAG: hypothetical protein K1X92_05130 [Bacteroidia bacterium]|nr:hypothetical protein [Bacteroidia bacterium]
MKHLLLLIIAMIPLSEIVSQNEFHKRMIPVAEVSGMWMPESKYPPSGQFSMPNAGFFAQIPVLQKKEDRPVTGIPSFHRIALNIGSDAGFLSIKNDSAVKQSVCLQPRIGITEFWYSGNNTLWIANATLMPGFTASSMKHKGYGLRGKGYLIYRRQPVPKEEFMFWAGAGYSYCFGRGMIYPILGVRGTLNKTETLHYNLFFPYSARVYFQPSEGWFGAGLRIIQNGGVYTDRDGVIVPDRKSEILRNRETTGGLYLFADIARSYRFTIDGGGIFFRNYSQGGHQRGLKKPSTVYSISPAPTYYLKASLSFLFGSKKYSDDFQNERTGNW